jgi:hypothetical protein
MTTRPDHAKDKFNFVLYVPEIRHQRFRVTEAGRVVLELAIHPLKRLMARLVHGQAVCEIELDALSSSAWLSMDGTRSVLDVARIQSEMTGDDLDEAVRRIVTFTRYIAKRGWIRFREGDPRLGS